MRSWETSWRAPATLPDAPVASTSLKSAAPANPSPRLLFADLPGYGYAKVSREISQDWARFVDPYLHQRSVIALCLALVDANVPPQDSDQQLIEFLKAAKRPYVLVATKCDRLSGNELPRALRTLGEHYSDSTILPFSAKTGSGKDNLWSAIRDSLANVTSV